MRVNPFHGLRYDPAVAGPHRETSAPPYDDLDPMRYTGHRTSNPYTVLELQAARPGRGGHAAARAALERWQRTGVLRTDDPPGLYLYETIEVRNGVTRTQRGVLCAVDLDDIDDGRLLLHEHVDAERSRQRVERLLQVPLDITPVVAVHLGGLRSDVRAAVDAIAATAPLVAFDDESAVEHRVWRIADPATVVLLCTAYEPITAVLADGHHRVAAARAVRDANREAGRPSVGYGATTAWLVDAVDHGPELRAVHRMVHTTLPSRPDGTPQLEGFVTAPFAGSPTGLEQLLADTSTLTFGVITGHGSWTVQPDDADAVRAVAVASAGPRLGGLDAQVLTSVLLPLLGHPPTEAAPDAAASARALHGRTDKALVLLRPATAQQVFDIAQAHERMPAKTTWFRPKPRAGLVMRRLDIPT